MNLVVDTYLYTQNLIGSAEEAGVAAYRLNSGTSSPTSKAERNGVTLDIPPQVAAVNRAAGVVNDVNVIKNFAAATAEGAIAVGSFTPGVDTAADVIGTYYYTITGNYSEGTSYAIGLFIPAVGGALIKEGIDFFHGAYRKATSSASGSRHVISEGADEAYDFIRRGLGDNKFPELSAEESEYINRILNNRDVFPANRLVEVGYVTGYEKNALSTDFMRVLSEELGGLEVAQVYVKNFDNNEGSMMLIYGSRSRIEIPNPSDLDGVPYLISHVHPAGSTVPSGYDISFLNELIKIQGLNGAPIQKKSSIIPFGQSINDFNTLTPHSGF